METAPLARQVVTIMGSISGVRPTAMEIPNKKASSQSFLVKPLMKNTKGTMTTIKRIRTQETALTPRVKLVSTASPARAEAMEPNSVWSPVLMNHRRGTPGNDVTAHKGNIRIFCDRLFLGTDIARLFDGFTFAGQTGLADKQVLGRHHADVGRNHIACR